MGFCPPSGVTTPNQYTQGSLVTLTVTTLNSNGQPVPPDNFNPPQIQISFESPNGAIIVINNAMMIPITNVWYYFNIDSTTLAVGSYVANISWFIQGQQNTATAYFSILPFDGAVISPIDPISRLRLRIKDNDSDPTRWVWTDQELSEYLQDSLDDLNSAPPLSSYFWFNVPLQYVQNILRGAEVLALEAQSVKLSHSPITYNDKGVTVNLQSQAQTYLSIASNLREKYEQERLRIKRQFAYGTGYITTPNLPYMSVPPIRSFGRFWNL